jgi:hypothetical protein
MRFPDRGQLGRSVEVFYVTVEYGNVEFGVPVADDRIVLGVPELNPAFFHSRKGEDGLLGGVGGEIAADLEFGL